MRYTVVCECSFDDVNGEYATYALAWGEACVHDVSVYAAFVQRVADALAKRAPEISGKCAGQLLRYGRSRPGHPPLVGMNGRQQPAPAPVLGVLHKSACQKRRAKKQNFRNILRKFDSGIPFVRPFVVTPPTLCYNK